MSLPVAAGAGVLSATSVGYALRQCRVGLDDRAEALLGVTAAGVFAAQMVNFPIPGGASGHLLGGTLAAVVLGPWAGVVALTCVLIVQCFLFADGGLLALGANVLNMAVVGCIAGSSIWGLLRPLAKSPGAQATAAGFAAWCSTVLVAAACAAELSWSGTFGWSQTLPLMVGIHAVIGLGEAVITGLVVSAWLRNRRVLYGQGLVHSQRKTGVLGGLTVAATIVVVLAPFSSQLPDGLQRTLELLGGADRERRWFSAWLADFEFPSLGRWGGAAAGLVGVGAVTTFGWIAVRLKAGSPAPDAAAP